MSEHARRAGTSTDLDAVKALIVSLLLASRFRARDLGRIVIVATNESKRVVLRAALAEELRHADLPTLAKECMARRVGVGQVLVYSSIESAGGPSVGFLVLSLVERRGRTG